MFSLFLLASAAMQSPQSSVVMYGGYGGVSCSNAWKAQYEQNSRTYVLGMWSGMNIAGSPSVGRSTDQNEVLDRIKGKCIMQPNELLTNATLQVYNSMRRQGQ